jgi:hypothetical protein
MNMNFLRILMQAGGRFEMARLDKQNKSMKG